MIKKLLSLALIFLMPLTVAVADSDNGAMESAINKVIANYVDEIVVGSYDEMQSNAEDFEKSCSTLLAKYKAGTLQQADIDEACSNYTELYRSWNTCEAMFLGPIEDYEDYDLNNQISMVPYDSESAYWTFSVSSFIDGIKGDNPGKYIFDTTKNSDDTYFGLQSLDYMLFRDGKNRTLESFTSKVDSTYGLGTVLNEDEVYFINAVASNIYAVTRLLYYGWSGDKATLNSLKSDAQWILDEVPNQGLSSTGIPYADYMKQSGNGSGMFNNPYEGLELITNSCRSAVEELVEEKIGMAYNTAMSNPNSREYANYIEATNRKATLKATLDVLLSVGAILYNTDYEGNGTTVEDNSVMSVLEAYNPSQYNTLKNSLASVYNELIKAERNNVSLPDPPTDSMVKSIVSGLNQLVSTFEETNSWIASCYEEEEKETYDDYSNSVVVDDMGITYVDLGLHKVWATCNLGASRPEQSGYFFAWGETASKESFSWNNYKWSDGTNTTLTKYVDSKSYGSNGFTDNKTLLDKSDDVANVALGGYWLMPSAEDYQELVDQCTWQQTRLNGVQGFKVTGRNGHSIFLPFSGCYDNGSEFGYEGRRGQMWTSSRASQDKAYTGRYIENGSHWAFEAERYKGATIRPVAPAASNALLSDNEVVDGGMGGEWGAAIQEDENGLINYGTYFEGTVTGKVVAIGPGASRDPKAIAYDGRSTRVKYRYTPSTGSYILYGGSYCSSPSANGGKGVASKAQAGYNSVRINSGVYIDRSSGKAVGTTYRWELYLRATLPQPSEFPDISTTPVNGKDGQGVKVLSAVIPPVAAVGEKYTATASIINNTSDYVSYGSYTAKLYLDGEKVATAGNDYIPENGIKRLEFSFYPKTTGAKKAMIVIKTDTSETKITNIVNIGNQAVAGDKGERTFSSPFNTVRIYSETEALYTPDELNLPVGARITRIAYRGVNSSTCSPEINIWLGETDKSTLENADTIKTDGMRVILSGGSIARGGDAYYSSDQKLIMAETADILVADFPESPYVYKGGNLDVVVRAGSFESNSMLPTAFVGESSYKLSIGRCGNNGYAGTKYLPCIRPALYITYLDGNGSATSIVTAKTASDAKATLDPDKPMFNLAGQRVNRSYRGIVLQNGKKYIKK